MSVKLNPMDALKAFAKNRKNKSKGRKTKGKGAKSKLGKLGSKFVSKQNQFANDEEAN